MKTNTSGRSPLIKSMTLRTVGNPGILGLPKCYIPRSEAPL